MESEAKARSPGRRMAGVAKGRSFVANTELVMVWRSGAGAELHARLSAPIFDATEPLSVRGL